MRAKTKHPLGNTGRIQLPERLLQAAGILQRIRRHHTPTHHLADLLLTIDHPMHNNTLQPRALDGKPAAALGETLTLR